MMLSHVTNDVFNSGDLCHFEFYFMTKIAIHIVVGASTTFIYLVFCNICYLILLSTFIRFLKFSLFFPCKNNHKFPINLSLKASIYSYSTTKEFIAWNEVSQERQSSEGMPLLTHLLSTDTFCVGSSWQNGYVFHSSSIWIVI